jgi:hypothetical protein
MFSLHVDVGLGKFGPVETKRRPTRLDRQQVVGRREQFAATAGQSHEAMFERGLNRGKGAAKEKCAAKMELMTARELASQTNL